MDGWKEGETEKQRNKEIKKEKKKERAFKLQLLTPESHEIQYQTILHCLQLSNTKEK